jgi:outer membrane protein assembly factor BamB
LQPASTDSLAYVGGATSDQAASAVTVSNGQVYLTGTVSTGAKTVGKDVVQTSDGFVAEIDPATGQTVWSRQYAGRNGVAAPTGIAVSAQGASILDKLGLPSGKVDFSASDQVVANTSARPGDEFYVRSGQGGAAKLVTIAANDTYKTLATKISRALGFQVDVKTLTFQGQTQIQIKPLNDRMQIELQAGPVGRDALGALGMSEALVTTDAVTAKATAPGSQKAGALAATNKLKAYYALALSSGLNLGSANDIKQAQSALQLALSTVRTIYGDMTTAPADPSASGGAAPKYLTDRIAQYQAALNRLTGGG